MTNQPKVDRPKMPAAYGIHSPTEEAGLLSWSFVSSRMEAARNYWIASASKEGRPHTAPVWGLWHRDAFYFSTDRNSRKGRNVAAQGTVIVHLESGDEVVIIEGGAEMVNDSTLLGELDDLYFKKYSYHLDAGMTYKIYPRIAMAWLERDFPVTATRWTFPG